MNKKQNHGMIGKKNALINDAPADCQLQIRINRQVKSKYVKQAQREGMKLSAWVLRTLDEACRQA